MKIHKKLLATVLCVVVICSFVPSLTPAALALTELTLEPGETYGFTNTTTNRVTVRTNSTTSSSTASYDRVHYAINNNVSYGRNETGSFNIEDRGRAVITNASGAYKLTITLDSSVTSRKLDNPALTTLTIGTNETYTIVNSAQGRREIKTTATTSSTSASYERVNVAVNGNITFGRNETGGFTLEDRARVKITNASAVYDFMLYYPYTFGPDLTITKRNVPALYYYTLDENRSVSLSNEAGGNIEVKTNASTSSTSPNYSYTRVNANGATDTRTNQTGNFTMADKSKWTITNTSSVYKLVLYTVYEFGAVIGLPAPAGGWITETSAPAQQQQTTQPSTQPTQTTQPAAQQSGGDAIPTASKVFINGVQTAFDAYTIRGSNYFKLRDLAFALRGTSKQFDVTWDGAANAINLRSNSVYTVIGGEMIAGDGQRKNATPTQSAILLDGRPVNLEAYNIGGNNYFRLRDIGRTFNFATDWDGANNAIMIDTSQPYRD